MELVFPRYDFLFEFNGNTTASYANVIAGIPGQLFDRRPVWKIAEFGLADFDYGPNKLLTAGDWDLNAFQWQDRAAFLRFIFM